MIGSSEREGISGSWIRIMIKAFRPYTNSHKLQYCTIHISGRDISSVVVRYRVNPDPDHDHVCKSKISGRILIFTDQDITLYT